MVKTTLSCAVTASSIPRSKDRPQVTWQDTTTDMVATAAFMVVGIAVLARSLLVRSQSVVASSALLRRQRNQPSDVGLQTFPAPSSSPSATPWGVASRCRARQRIHARDGRTLNLFDHTYVPVVTEIEL